MLATTSTISSVSRSRRLVGCAVVGACLLAACGDDDEAADTTVAETAPTTEAATTVAPTTTAAAASTTTEAPEPVDDAIRQPLTGEVVDSESDLVTRPALAVKIDNHPEARPNHSGLAVADLVFEEKVEGSLTRFAAVLHTNDADPIGPIRSGRSQDVDLLSSLNEPLFAWSGGNPGVTALVADSSLTDLNWQRNAGSYQRGPGRAPHNLYSDSETLWGLTPDDHPGPPAQQFRYLSEGEESTGEPATGIEMTIGSIDIEWNWNEDTMSYDRRQEGADHVDTTYGQLSFENVVVLVVNYQPSQIDASSPEAQTVGDGPAFVFRDGKLVEGRWAREASTFPFELTDADGEPIELSVGSTFVELGEAIPSDDVANPAVDLQFTG